MHSANENLENLYTRWLLAYRVTQALLIGNMGLIFFNIFTEWKSAYQFIYGDSSWPAIGIALVLTVFLSKTYGAAHLYYELLTEYDSRAAGKRRE